MWVEGWLLVELLCCGGKARCGVLMVGGCLVFVGLGVEMKSFIGIAVGMVVLFLFCWEQKVFFLGYKTKHILPHNQALSLSAIKPIELPELVQLVYGNGGFAGNDIATEVLIRRFCSTALVDIAKRHPHSQVMLSFSGYLLAAVGRSHYEILKLLLALPQRQTAEKSIARPIVEEGVELAAGYIVGVMDSLVQAMHGARFIQCALEQVVSLSPDERAKVLHPHLAKEAIVFTVRRLDVSVSTVLVMALKRDGGNAASVKVMVEEYLAASTKRLSCLHQELDCKRHCNACNIASDENMSVPKLCNECQANGVPVIAAAAKDRLYINCCKEKSKTVGSWVKMLLCVFA